MKTKLSLLLAACCLLFISHLNAQNTPQLKDITAHALQQLMKEHKNIHFVTENGAKGPILKYYEEPKQLTSAVSPSTQNGESAGAANFHLTKDINTQTDANPVNSDFIDNKPYAVLNKIMYFSADDGIHGAELWRSDGTTAGTYLVSDLAIGNIASNPNQIITGGNKLFFATHNFSTNSYKLWTSDGTADGTIELKDLLTTGPGVNGSYNLTNVDGTVFFFVKTRTFGFEQLWKTDGTISGTILVNDFGANTFDPFAHAAAQGLFYFNIFDTTTGRELWRSDGTNVGTFLVKDISASTDFLEGSAQLTAFNNKLYFSADDGSGRKLWFTDGTAAGTQLAPNTNNVLVYTNYSDFFTNEPFAVQNDNLYMSASVPATGSELYKYNAMSGFSLVKDITPGAAGGFIYNITPAFNDIAFEYSDTLNKTTALWKTNGLNKTGLLKAASYETNTYFNNLTAANNLLYFVSTDTTHGAELWKTAGTPASTVLVKDIYAGSTSSYPASLTNFNNKLYFNAASKKAGTELWQSDGNAANTNMVTEINKTKTNFSGPNFSFGSAYGTIPGSTIGNSYYFSATKPETGYELYKSDGTGAGTGLISDIIPGENGSFPRSITTKNNAVYYIASGTDSAGNYFYNVYKTDSTGKTSAGIPFYDGFIDAYAVADNGLVYYIKEDFAGKYELWRTDGTVAGSFMLTDKVSRANYPFAIKTIGNIAYFVGSDENGAELWSSNGSIANTKIVKDINAGGNSSLPYSLYVYKNNIFFGADDGSGIALWRSNGTASGTIKVKAIQPYGVSYAPDYNNFFCIVNNVLYLNASTPDTGNELWKTNGTSNGTVLVKDLTGDANSSDPAFLTNVNGSLFFSALNNQLWKTDGTAANTVIIQTIASNNYYSIFSERCVADGKFFFNTNQLLWVSNGTNAGTHPVQDNGLNGVSLVTNLAAANNTVFFNGYTDKYSYELYAGDATKVTTSALAANKLQSQIHQPASFTALVLQNPVTNKLTIQIKSDKNQTINIIVSNAYGNVIAQQKFIAGKGVAAVNINAGSWQTGIYTVKLYNNAADAVSMQVLK